MPRNKDDMRHNVAEFESKFEMPQAFGCIDGTYIHWKGLVKIPRNLTTSKVCCH